MSSTTLFDISVRTLECPECGAPLQCPRGGGQVTCTHCHANVVVQMRRPSKHAGRKITAADEIVRLAALRAQLKNRTPGHKYDLSQVPRGLEPAARPSPERRAFLEQAWARVRDRHKAQQPIDGHFLCWLAVNLATEYFKAGDDLKSRAVLESALNVHDDEGHQEILRCRLAFEAAHRGEAAAATAWLAECDPAPKLLELDGEHRIARARLAILEQDHETALTVLGRDARNMVAAPLHRLHFAALRIAALEGQRDVQSAWKQLEIAERTLGNAKIHALATELALSPLTLAADRTVEQQRTDHVQTKRKRTRRSCLGVTFFIFAVAAAGGGIAYRQSLEPDTVPIVCEINDTITIDNINAKLSGTLISAHYGCTVIIRNSTLEGARIVDAKPNVTVRVIDSKLIASGTAISMGHRSSLEIRGSEVTTTSEDPAIDINGPELVKLRDTTVVSEGDTIALSDGAVKVDLRDSTIRSGGVAIHTTAESLTLYNCIIDGEQAFQGVAEKFRIKNVRVTHQPGELLELPGKFELETCRVRGLVGLERHQGPGEIRDVLLKLGWHCASYRKR